MGIKKRGSVAIKRPDKGAPVYALSTKERRLLESKQRKLREVVQRLHVCEATVTPAATGASRSEGDATAAAAAAADDEVDTVFRTLRDLAFAPHGFVSDEIRQAVWPVLLGHRAAKPVGHEHELHYRHRNGEHRDDQQIEKDILRSLWHYDVTKGIKETERRVKRKQLTQIINSILMEHPDLYYFQGYHDICSVFLLVLGDEAAFRAMNVVSTTYHREPMRKSFEVVLHTTRLLYPLLESEDAELFAHIQGSGVEPFFALPWMITWFAHDLLRLSHVARIYDVLLVSHPLFVLYISAAVVLEARRRVLKTDCDFGTLHGLLAKLPLTMDIEAVITRAAIIFHRFPPTELLKRSDHQADLKASMYAQFPFKHHAHFSPITAPFLEPDQYQRSMGHKEATSWLKSCQRWQTPILVGTTAAFLGLAAVALSYIFQDRIQSWLTPVVPSVDGGHV